MRVYKILLRLYPASFRSEYGAEMCQVFAARRRMSSNNFAVIALWIETLFDVLPNATRVHWDILRQDLRYTARSFGRSPAFALTVIVVTGLGIGANTAIFSITDHVLIRSLPFEDAGRLVKLWETTPGYPRMEPSPPNYRDWQRMSSSFATMGAFVTAPMTLIGQGDPKQLEGSLVSSEVFATLGVEPLLGRSFTANDDREGVATTAILSYELWQAEFGGDSAVMGRSIRLNDTAYTVIGVMPANFYFPGRASRLWIPLFSLVKGSISLDRNNNILQVLAKLKSDVSLEQARAEMALITDRLEREYPKENAKTKAVIIPLSDELTEQSRLLLGALFGASMCLVLIACTNLASLMLARVMGRQQELTIRAAIGAGRERLVRQLVTESLVLAVLGGVVGVMFGVGGLPLVTELIPTNLPTGDVTALNFRVLMFAALLTGVTGLGFGVIPALRSCSATRLGALRSKPGIGARRERLRLALVVAQVSLSVVLLTSSSLLIRALLRVRAVNPGFRTENVLAVNTPLPMGRYESAASRLAFYSGVLPEVRALPGVTNAAYISFLPMVMRGGIFPVNGVQRTSDDGAGSTASLRFVTPGFFSSLQIPLRLGRDVSELDAEEAPAVAVISESFALRQWPGRDPIGQEFGFASRTRTVVGVVGEIRVRGLERNSEPQVYLPYKQVTSGGLEFYSPKELIVRSANDPRILIPAIRRIVQKADPELPLDFRMVEDIVRAETASRVTQLMIIGAFAALSLLLAGLGVHGLLSFVVTQRIPEIGIRMALGASTGDIIRMVLRQGLLLAGIGCSLGVVVGYAAGLWIEALLAGIRPADLPSFAAAATLALIMTISGSLVPALRAVRVDPTTVIRME